MVKRARISALIALIAAFVGFTGIFQATAGIAQTVFFGLMSFSVLSLVLSLFEETPEQLKARPLVSEVGH